MPKTKITVTPESELLNLVDELIARRGFANRSQAIEATLAEKLYGISRSRLATACVNLNKRREQRLADEGIAGDAKSWPEY